MSEDLTVTYAGLNADEKRVVINDKRAVRLRHGCAITELRALDRTASELQETCHKQAQRIAELEQAARQALEALQAYERPVKKFGLEFGHGYAAITALREALEAVPQTAAVVQEPVTWMFQHEETGRITCVDAHEVEDRWFEEHNPRWKKVRPLYTAPQPARQPLTEGELDLILQKSPIKANYADLTALVRAVEKVHGIGGEA